MSEFKVNVGVNLDDSELDSLDNRLKKLKSTPIPIKIEIDADGIKNLENQVSKQVRKMTGNNSVGNIKIGADVDAKKMTEQGRLSAKQYLASINSELKKDSKQIKKVEFPSSLDEERLLYKSDEAYADHLSKRLKKEISALSTIENSVGKQAAEEIERVSSQIERDMQALKHLAKGFDGDLKTGLRRNLVDVDDKLDVDFAKRQDEISKQEQKAFEKRFSNLRKASNEKRRLRREMDTLDKGPEEYAADNKRWLRLLEETTIEYSKLRPNLTDDMLDVLNEDIAKDSAKRERAIAKHNDKVAKQEQKAFEQRVSNLKKDVSNGLKDVEKLSDIRIASAAGKFDDRFNNIENQSDDLRKLANSFNEAKESAIGYRDAFAKAMDGDDLEAQAKSARELSASLKELDRVGGDYRAALDDAERIQKNDKSLQKNEASIRKLETAKKQFELKSNNWLKNNSAAADEFGQRIEVLNQRMKSAKTDIDYKNVVDDFNTLKLEAEAAGKAHMTFWDGLKNQARQYASYIGVAGVAMAGGQAFRMMAQNVLEVDTAMTGLYRVTDLTSQQYDELYDKMIASSKVYGRTLTDTINATSDWVRAGYDEQTALGLADVTAMYQNVSDLDYDEATKNLLTSLNGFKDELISGAGGDATGAAEHIVDVLNKLDKLSCPQGTISVKGRRRLRPSKDCNIIKQVYGDILKWKTNTKSRIKDCLNIYTRLGSIESIALKTA